MQSMLLLHGPSQRPETQLGATLGQSAPLVQAPRQVPPIVSQYGYRMPGQFASLVQAAPHTPVSALAGSREQLGAAGWVQSAWAVHGPTQTPSLPQFGRLASGQPPLLQSP